MSRALDFSFVAVVDVFAAYENFQEWNPRKEIYSAAEALYKTIDNLELHVRSSVVLVICRSLILIS